MRGGLNTFATACLLNQQIVFFQSTGKGAREEATEGERETGILSPADICQLVWGKYQVRETRFMS